MPEENPRNGEVWRMLDPENSNEHSALIVGTVPGSDALLMASRSGRVIPVPRRSVILSWRLSYTSEPGACTTYLCRNPAYLRTLTGQRVCLEHIPRSQPLLLPADPVEIPPVAVQATLDRCPICNASKTESRSWQVIEKMVVYHCKCRGRWIQVIPKGSVEDGIQIGWDISTACTILEADLCATVQVRIGSSALAKLRRAFSEIPPTNPRYTGIPLEVAHTLGDSLVVFGVAATADDLETSFGVIPLNSYWQHLQRESRILRLIAVQETTRLERLVTLNNVLNESEQVQMSEVYLHQAYRSVPKPEVNNDPETGGTWIRFPPDPPWMSYSDAEVPTLDSHEIVKAIPRASDPEPCQPASGDLWWHTGSGTPVQIFGVGTSSNSNDFVRLTLDTGIAVRMLTDDFRRYHFKDNLLEIAKIGEDYEEVDTQMFYKIESITPQEVHLIDESGGPLVLDLPTFRGNFRKVHWRTALERLLQDDDLV